ncbi:MAG: class A beta-lactamase [Povalibacter sp.]
MIITRRAALISALCACVTRAAFSADTMAAGLAELEHESGGRLGVCALDIESGRTLLSQREHERFAMCSTFKLLLAGALLAKVDAHALDLTQSVKFTRDDLLSYAPATSARVNDGAMTLEELCSAMVTVSDNTAANLLLPLVDGPQGLTRWLRTLDDQVTRLDRNEPELNSNLPGDLRDTTTPHAMAQTTARLLKGNVLAKASRERLKAWMVAADTGVRRIRAGVSKDWVVGDKTGTGANGAVNDVAIAWPPGRAPIVVAIYMSGSTRPTSELETIQARTAGLLV